MGPTSPPPKQGDRGGLRPRVSLTPLIQPLTINFNPFYSQRVSIYGIFHPLFCNFIFFSYICRVLVGLRVDLSSVVASLGEAVERPLNTRLYGFWVKPPILSVTSTISKK